MTDETGKVIISLEKGRIRVESEGLDEEMVVNLLAESLINEGYRVHDEHQCGNPLCHVGQIGEALANAVEDVTAEHRKVCLHH